MPRPPLHSSNSSSTPPSSQLVHMDVCDLLNLKVQEQSQMISILEKELTNTRDALKRKNQQFQDYRVDAAKNLAKQVHESRVTTEKLKQDGAVEESRLKAVVRDLELQLFKEKLRTKQLEESSKKVLNQFAVTRQQDVDTIVQDLSQLRSTITKSLAHRLKTADLRQD